MSEPSEEKKKRPLPQNLAGKAKASPLQSDQFESMTELGRAAAIDLESQNHTFEIFQGEEIVASKRTRPITENTDIAKTREPSAEPKPAAAPSIYNPRGLAETWTEESEAASRAETSPSTAARAAAPTPPSVEPDAAQYQLAKTLESDCLELIKYLSQNIALMAHLSESQKRIELLLSLRAMVKDPDTTGIVATTAALICGYYRDSKQGDFDTSEEQEPYGLFAMERYSLCEYKRQRKNVLPDSFEQFVPAICSGFAVNQNFLLALYGRLLDARASNSTQSIADTIGELIRVGRDGFTVTFPGALAPIKIEAATQGELAFGSADTGGTESCYVALLEKAYGQYLALTIDKDARPTLSVEAAWATHNAAKAHLGLRLLTGHTPRVLTAPPYSQRKEWKDTVANALRQCRAQGQRAYVVMAASDDPAVLDVRVPVLRANQIVHGMVSFNGSAIELATFDSKGVLITKTITFDQLFAPALAFYAVLE